MTRPGKAANQAQDESVVVSVVFALNEHSPLQQEFLSRLAAVLSAAYKFYEIIIVDDGSDHTTAQETKKLLAANSRVRCLWLSRVYGKEVALAAGLETAIGDFVVTIDPEADPVDLIPSLVERCRSGSGVLYGICSPAPREGWFTRLAGSLFRRYCRIFLHLEYRQNATDFRVLSRKAVNAVCRIKDRQRYLKVFLAVLGHEQDTFVYTPTPTKKRADNFWQRAERALDIAIAHSRHPLRLVSRIGLSLSALNLVYALYIMLVYALKSDVEAGWTTMSMQMTGMFFFLFLILAVLCEYVGRILEETQERPLYYVMNEETSSVLLENSIESSVVEMGGRA
jgi:glycosyltransferase involved in cell wall biosynthesis